MSENFKAVDFNRFIDEGLAKDFVRVCTNNGVTAEFILGGFIRDYIVSGGHPEHVIGGMPWNKRSRKITSEI